MLVGADEDLLCVWFLLKKDLSLSLPVVAVGYVGSKYNVPLRTYARTVVYR